MDKAIEDFARNYLRENVPKLVDDSQIMFKRICYNSGKSEVLKHSVEDSIKRIKVSRLDNAVRLVRSSLECPHLLKGKP